MKKWIQTLIKPTYTKQWFTDLLLAIPRIIGFLFLAKNFGGSKFPCPQWFIDDVSKFGGLFSTYPAFFAWSAVLSETIGGLLLVLGLGTRMASFFVAITMMVAIFFQKWNSDLWEMLPALSFLWLSIYALVLGSGRFGLDHLISKKYF